MIGVDGGRGPKLNTHVANSAKGRHHSTWQSCLDFCTVSVPIRVDRVYAYGCVAGGGHGRDSLLAIPCRAQPPANRERVFPIPSPHSNVRVMNSRIDVRRFKKII